MKQKVISFLCIIITTVSCGKNDIYETNQTSTGDIIEIKTPAPESRESFIERQNSAYEKAVEEFQNNYFQSNIQGKNLSPDELNAAYRKMESEVEKYRDITAPNVGKNIENFDNLEHQ